MAKSKSNERCDPSDAICLLTGSRLEEYPLERELQLMGFLGWLHWPDDHRTISQLQSVASAQLFLKATKRERAEISSGSPKFNAENFADALIQYANQPLQPLNLLLEANEVFADEIANIISFFVCCPKDLKPSFLKAIFFIDEGGFLTAEQRESADVKYLKRSPATSKAVWSKRAISGPFVWTAMHMGFNDIFRLSPHSTRSIERLLYLAANEQRLIKYFRYSLFCQQLLQERLAPESKSRIKFIKFPASLTPLDLKYGTFEDDQLKILKRYRAPKSI